MYVHVTAKGAMSFRMDYRLNGRRETIYLGKYGPDGLSLARAREKCIDARRNIAVRYSHCPNLCLKLAVLLPSRYDADAPMSRTTFNRVTYSVVEQAKQEGLPLEPFTVHDLRRTGSTLLNELGFNSDWIEKCLAHEDGRSSRGVYNKAEYEVQRRHMMQEWSDVIDAWVSGRKRVPVLIPPSMPLLEPDPALEQAAIAAA